MKLVYFIRPVGELGPVKIGCSKWPEKRVKALLIWSPIELEIAASAPGIHAHERILHYRFADQHKHGEWFDYSPELGELIDFTAKNGALPPLEVPVGAAQWKVHREANSGRLPRRNAKFWGDKYRISKRVMDAERRVYTHWGLETMRPAEINEIMQGYQGFDTFPPNEAQIAVLEQYIAKLAEMPAADRSLARWNDWHKAVRA